MAANLGSRRLLIRPSFTSRPVGRPMLDNAGSSDPLSRSGGSGLYALNDPGWDGAGAAGAGENIRAGGRSERLGQGVISPRRARRPATPRFRRGRRPYGGASAHRSTGAHSPRGIGAGRILPFSLNTSSARAAPSGPKTETAGPGRAGSGEWVPPGIRRHGFHGMNRQDCAERAAFFAAIRRRVQTYAGKFSISAG